MQNIFSPDSPFIEFMSKVGNLVLLNLVFLITCIPVVTIGAAWTALYSVTLKKARGEEPYIIKRYFKAFGQNFKQATIMWLICLFFIALLFLDYQVMRYQSSALANVMRIALIAVILAFYMTLSYVFPCLASFDNSIKQTFQNAALIAIYHYKKTIPILLIPVVAIVITLLSAFTLYYGILLWLLIGFAGVAQMKSLFFVQVFDYYINKPEPEEITPDEEFSVEMPEGMEFQDHAFNPYASGSDPSSPYDPGSVSDSIPASSAAAASAPISSSEPEEHDDSSVPSFSSDQEPGMESIPEEREFNHEDLQSIRQRFHHK